MKRLFTLTLCFGLALAMTAQAEPGDRKKKRTEKTERFQKGKRSGNNARNIVREAGSDRRKDGRRRDGKRNRAGREAVRSAASFVDALTRPNGDVRVRESRRGRRGGDRRRSISRRGPSEFAWSFGEARGRHHRGRRHNRAWYRSNYSRFALFAGGYYYYDRGYWYPAYGYDSRYSTYRYDEPIYGYNNLAPKQVIVNVQNELQSQDYYEGSIDGLLGPQTRSALGLYQRDLGLEVTRSIDGPTLAALGLN